MCEKASLRSSAVSFTVIIDIIIIFVFTRIQFKTYFFPRFENVYIVLGILTILLSRLFVARNRFKAFYYRYRFRSGRSRWIYKLLKIYNIRIYLYVLNVFLQESVRFRMADVPVTRIRGLYFFIMGKTDESILVYIRSVVIISNLLLYL